MNKLGHIAFVGGVLIAIIAGLLQTTSTFFAFSLLLLGLVIGFLNITAREVTPFLIAAIALIVAGSADFQVLNVIFHPLGGVLNSIFANIQLFVAPVVIVVSVKSIIDLA